MTVMHCLWREALCLAAATCLLAARPVVAQVLDSPIPCDGAVAAGVCLSDEEIYLEAQSGDFTVCQDCSETLCSILCAVNFDQYENCLELGDTICIDAVLPPGAIAYRDGKGGGAMPKHAVWPPQSPGGDAVRKSRRDIAIRLIEEGREDDAMRYTEVCALQDRMRTIGLTVAEVHQLLKIARQPAKANLPASKAMSSLALLAQRGLLPAELHGEAVSVALAGLLHPRALVRAPSVALLAALAPTTYRQRFEVLRTDPNPTVARLARRVLEQLQERRES